MIGGDAGSGAVALGCGAPGPEGAGPGAERGFRGLGAAPISDPRAGTWCSVFAHLLATVVYYWLAGTDVIYLSIYLSIYYLLC